MKHAIIVGHPDPDSFTMAMAKAYTDALPVPVHTHVLRDLYRLDFDPRVRLSEIADRERWTPAPDVIAEREMLRDADVFAFIYPLWFNSPPAIIKGYIERVFGAGFGFAQKHGGGMTPLLTGRQLVHISASGSRLAWLNEQGVWSSLRTLFDEYFGTLCGMHVHPHIHFDSIVPGIEQRWINENLNTLQTKVRDYFGAD
jgi:NAD(P)H dehydrogenase (quinone)